MSFFNKIKQLFTFESTVAKPPQPVSHCNDLVLAQAGTYSDKMLYILGNHSNVDYDAMQEYFDSIFDIEFKRDTMRGLMSRLKIAGAVYKQDDVWYLT